MTRIHGDWLDRPETQTVCAMLTSVGHQALFVGGCVRNTVLGEPVNDIDIATDARPETVIALARKEGLKPVPTGIDHGTITVVSGGLPHEVTTFRRDVETFGRHAVIAYTDDVTEDARRRDFTMNALYAGPDGGVTDPLNGLPDLRARRVRFIEDAEARIKEDYLRIMRFFRFHAWYGDPMGGLDPDGLAACAALSDGIETLSRERIGSELLKLLAAPDPAPSLASMQSAGCLARALPGADPRGLSILVALEAASGVAPNRVRRLAAIGGEDPAEHLRLSKKQTRDAAAIRRWLAEPVQAPGLGYRLGHDLGLDTVLVRAALLEQPLPIGFRSDLELGADAVFPLRAADLPALSGPALGERLRALENRWIASGFALNRDELLGGA